MPNYSYLLGDLSAAALSNLHYPKANRGAGLVFTNTAVGLAGRIGLNIVREIPLEARDDQRRRARENNK